MVFVARVLVQMVIFWHRRISWTEALAEAGFIIPLSLCSLAWGAARRREPVGWKEALGFVVFLGGTWVNVHSELQRHLWKADPANAGRLFTLGLWQRARHINYFGEIASFAGLALFCGVYNLWIAVAMGVGMGGFSVPELDFYLERKYPDEWAAYVEAVPFHMVPGVW